MHDHDTDSPVTIGCFSYQNCDYESIQAAQHNHRRRRGWANRETNKQIDTNRQTDKQRERESERSGEADILAQRQKGREGKAARKADRHVLDRTDKTARTDGPTEGQTDRQTTRQIRTPRQTERQADADTDRARYTNGGTSGQTNGLTY